MSKLGFLGLLTVFSLTTLFSVAQDTPWPQIAVTYKTIQVDGLNIAYREAGDPASPKLVLLHGFPASSHQYRNLVPALADSFHVIAPYYPGFGNSDRPDPANFPIPSTKSPR